MTGVQTCALPISAFGVGAVLGNAVALRFKPSRTLVASFTAMLLASLQGAFFASGVGTGGIALLELLAGVGVALFYTLWESTIQEQVPPEATARVAAYDWGISVGLMPVGLLLAAPLADLLGVEEAMRAGTAVGIIAGLACLSVPAVRQVRRAR